MNNTIFYGLACVFIMFSTGLSPVPSQPSDRITIAGQDIFMSGGNVAWIDFARDIGPENTASERFEMILDQFEEIFQDVHLNGGNTMRLWLHTNGTSTPQWKGDRVVGPGENTIRDLHEILDLAQLYNINLMLCLWSFDMLHDGQVDLDQTQRDLNRSILEEDDKMQAYIDNALIPMVDALKDHPAVGAWEIFNEPEGMSQEISHANWAYESTSIEHVQKFINRSAGAIKRTDPNVKVTNGSWNFRVLTDIGSFHNYYRDDRLIAAGDDEDGTLDFYTVHYYANHFGTDTSPFHHDAEYWELDKPIVVAEFWPVEIHGVAVGDLYTTLYDRGYAGALAWSWEDTDEPWEPALQNMQTLAGLYPAAVQFSIADEVLARISAFPEHILEGQTSELDWFSSGAESVTLNGENVELRGTLEVTPADTTEYTLIATGDDEKADTGRVTVYVVPPDQFNWAFQKPAYASSIENQAYRAVFATDGDRSTRWSSAYSDGEWIYIDLQEAFDIDRVVLDWETAFGEQYDIDISMDGVQWDTVYEERGGTGGEDEIVFEEPYSGRYVRMYGHRRGTQWGFSLYEMQVFGMQSGLQPPSVTLTRPSADRIFDTGDPVRITAEVEPGTHPPDTVRFELNGEELGALTEAPWEYTWTAGEPGDYELSAVVIDAGFTIRAHPVALTIQEIPESVFFDTGDAELSLGAVLHIDETARNGTYVNTGDEGRMEWNGIDITENRDFDIRIGYRLDEGQTTQLTLRFPPFVTEEVELVGEGGEWRHRDIRQVRLTGRTGSMILTNDGHSVDIDYLSIRGEGVALATRTGGQSDLPDEYALQPNYPNPFNPVTAIGYQLPVDSHVRIEIYDILGRRVVTLINDRVKAGRHEVRFDASRFSSGAYIYRMKAGDFVQTRQMMLTK